MNKAYERITEKFLQVLSRGIDAAVIENQQAYVQGWVSALENNPKWIVQAASKAEKAVKHILGNKAEAKAAA
jgi:antirestriction protein ArdC